MMNHITQSCIILMAVIVIVNAICNHNNKYDSLCKYFIELNNVVFECNMFLKNAFKISKDVNEKVLLYMCKKLP